MPSDENTSPEYAFDVTLPVPFDEAVRRARAALADEGFGVLTEIDVTATLQNKIGASMEPYLILGACNPPLAHQALSADRTIGVLLPCNVVVRSLGPEETLIQALDPAVMATMSAAPDVAVVAEQAAAKLRSALAACARG